MEKTPAGRWLALDGLRGIAILMVVADHGGLSASRRSGPAGVTIFFVLSGFLITSVILKDRLAGSWSMLEFFLSRAARLSPALLVLEVVVSGWWIVTGRSLVDLAEYTAAATFYVTNVFYPGLVGSVLDTTWSLATEEQFYLLWPLVLPLLLRARRPLVWLGLAVAASVAARLALASVGFDHFAYANLPTNAFALLLGCAIAIAGPQVRPSGLQRAVPLVALLVILLLVRGPTHLPQIYITLPIAVVGFAAVAVVYALPGTPLLELGALRFVGRISYAWYLWHWPLLFLTGQIEGGLGAVPMLLLSFAIAVASTLFVEEPVRRAWRARRRAAGKVAAFRLDDGTE